MWLKSFKLTHKQKLTHDVYELVFKCEEDLSPLPGQFMTFLLPNIWSGRAYSIAENLGNWKTSYLIKRLEEGRWWSKEICDLDIWATLQWVWPSGHFTLKENDKNKLFIGTGTGFVPLYYQILESCKIWLSWKLFFIFWVRTSDDLFYLDRLENIKSQNNNFDYRIFLSREESKEFKKWYVTDYLNIENIWEFEEFYICWSPAMVEDAREKICSAWWDKDKIFSEKY